MKELTNQDIKDVSLQILIDIHEFCIENNIRYSLAYGTLIGAIRHKGFIPWDDDVDILMPREDYDRFFKTYKSKNGYVGSAPQTNDSYMFFGRVYDTKKTSSKPWRPQGTLENTGVWIDVFPIDVMPDDRLEYERDVRSFIRLYDRVHMKRECMISFSEMGGNPLRIAKLAVKKIMTMNLNLVSAISSFDKGIEAYAGKNSLYKGFMANNMEVFQERLPSSIYEKFIPAEFEGRQFMILAEYDAYLRNFYGDYMQFPPEEKRVYSHSSHKFYWK